MLKYFVLLGIFMIAVGHLWCGHLALQKQGYWRWAFWGVWRFIFSDWKEAKRPCTLMLAGLIMILAGIGLHLLGFGNL